ncbi:MAG: hypothetical protein WCF69_16720 [Mycobacterium sp.]
MSHTNQPLIGLINSGNWFAQLVFYPNGAVLPTDGLVDGQPCLYYCYALLRHEEVVYLIFNGPGSQNFLSTFERAPGT